MALDNQIIFEKKTVNGRNCDLVIADRNPNFPFNEHDGVLVHCPYDHTMKIRQPPK